MSNLVLLVKQMNQSILLGNIIGYARFVFLIQSINFLFSTTYWVFYLVFKGSANLIDMNTTDGMAAPAFFLR